jgi:YfiH family protein
MRTEPRGRTLCDPVLEATGAFHGFGERGAQAPESTVFPRQVHGVRAVRAMALTRADRGEPEEADAIVSRTPADCVPILLASRDGSRVGAIHAGWRGLAAGVIESGIDAMDVDVSRLVAAVGPAARGCCYEVDEPVASALAVRYAALLQDVLVPGRPGHFQLDLPRLASRVLRGLGLAPDRVGAAHRLCTICTPGPRFESFRRDGKLAGRIQHFIRPAARPGVPG